jgi:IS30 family transposase
MTKFDHKKFHKLYKTTKNNSELARKLGVHPSTVSYHIKKLQTELSSSSKTPKPRTTKISKNRFPALKHFLLGKRNWEVKNWLDFYHWIFKFRNCQIQWDHLWYIGLVHWFFWVSLKIYFEKQASNLSQWYIHHHYQWLSASVLAAHEYP